MSHACTKEVPAASCGTGLLDWSGRRWGDDYDAGMYRRSTLYNWVLKPRAIQFWFDKYEVSAVYCGAVSVTVPWRELLLTPAGQLLADQVG